MPVLMGREEIPLLSVIPYTSKTNNKTHFY